MWQRKDEFDRSATFFFDMSNRVWEFLHTIRSVSVMDTISSLYSSNRKTRPIFGDSYCQIATHCNPSLTYDLISYICTKAESYTNKYLIILSSTQTYCMSDNAVIGKVSLFIVMKPYYLIHLGRQYHTSLDPSGISLNPSRFLVNNYCRKPLTFAKNWHKLIMKKRDMCYVQTEGPLIQWLLTIPLHPNLPQ